MSLLDDLKAVGKVSVSGSAEYAVAGAAFSEKAAPIVDEGLAAHSAVDRSWRLSCIAVAQTTGVDDPAAVPALIDTLRSTLCAAGKAVTLTQFNGEPGSAVRTLPAPGASGGSLNGWPKVSLSIDRVVGAVVLFTLEAEARIPVPGAEAPAGYHLVSHAFRLRTSADGAGITTVRRSGTVRVAPDEDASAYIAAVITGPAETAALAAGRLFESSIDEGPDASVAGYEYSDKGLSAGGWGASVTEAEVSESLAEDLRGRRTTTVSGWSRGSSATAFAESQEPTPGAAELLTSRRVSAPREPDGRVDFAYEVLTGVASSSLPGGVIFSLTQTIEKVSGGRVRSAFVYADTPPAFAYGPIEPWRYVERTSLEFTGLTCDAAFATAVFTPRMDAAAIAYESRPVYAATGAGLRRIDLTRVYEFGGEQTIPAPAEAPGL